MRVSAPSSSQSGSNFTYLLKDYPSDMKRSHMNQVPNPLIPCIFIYSISSITCRNKNPHAFILYIYITPQLSINLAACSELSTLPPFFCPQPKLRIHVAIIVASLCSSFKVRTLRSRWGSSHRVRNPQVKHDESTMG